MVTRKPVGPPLSTSTSPKQKNASPNANPPYPTTPTGMPELDRAKTIHSATSVYSPNLNTSPAFDLIDMDQARQRPRRDSDVSSHGTWDSEDEDTPEDGDIPPPLRITPSRQNMKAEVDGSKDEHPSILMPGPANGVQPRRSQETMRYEDEAHSNPWAAPTDAVPSEPLETQAQPRNPYRRPETNEAVWDDFKPAPPSNAPPAPPVELPTVRTPADEMAKMSFAEQKPFETAEVISVPQQGRPPLASVVEQNQQESQQFFATNNPWRQQPSSSQQRPEEHQQVETAPAPPPGPPPKSPSQQEESQYAPPPGPPPKDFAQPSQQQYAPPPGPPPKGLASTALIDHEEPSQQQSGRPAPISTSQHPASSSETVPETPGTRARRQRSENYAIKHVNWYDASFSSDPRFKSSMRRSPILTQNANGPCPLLALVNALVLSTPQNVDTPLIETLRTREQVSLGLLLDAVFDELMSGRRGDSAQELPDVSELYSFLLALHTGMNVNPRFVTPASAPRGSLDEHPPEKAVLHPSDRAQTKAGCFEETKEMRLYSTFNVPLIHGWTAPKDTPAYAAFERNAQTFEDAQNIQFLESELEDKQRAEGLGTEEQQVLQDIKTIKSFLNNWPTQLTDYGLETIATSLKPGQIAILFRNDHFSTLYKEPKHGALMTLVTDAGYSSHDEIVWESLVDVNGAASEMFSGDFRAVSHQQDARLNQEYSAGGEEGWQTVQGRNRQHDQRSQNRQGPMRVANESEDPPPLPGPRPGRQQQGTSEDALAVPADVQRTASEQEDHDLALALQLQEEEEDHQRQAEERRRREQQLSEQFLSNESSGGEGPRPPIPPRRSGANNTRTSQAPTGGRPPVNRADDDPDAPPSYEASSSDRIYRPAGATAPPTGQGNPLNAYDALRRQQSAYAAQSSSTTVNSVGSAAGRRVSSGPQPQGNRIRRRSSQMGVPPGAYGGSPPGGPGAGRGRVNQAAGVQDAEERCSVM